MHEQSERAFKGRGESQWLARPPLNRIVTSCDLRQGQRYQGSATAATALTTFVPFRGRPRYLQQRIKSLMANAKELSYELTAMKA